MGCFSTLFNISLSCVVLYHVVIQKIDPNIFPNLNYSSCLKFKHVTKFNYHICFLKTDQANLLDSVQYF